MGLCLASTQIPFLALHVVSGTLLGVALGAPNTDGVTWVSPAL